MSFNEVNQSTSELTQIAGSTLTSVYADAPIGAISAYGGDVAPTGWLLCNGAAISRTTYAELYAVIGTKFGSGDGSTTFNLPDGSISASVYPVEGVGKYIIKAVQTSVPADFETALETKQNITDNALNTTSKTVPGAINEVNSLITNMNIVSITRVSRTVTTGDTGNISTEIVNDGQTLVFGAFLNAKTGFCEVWVHPTLNTFYITVHDPNSNNVIPNTSVELRYYVLTCNE